MSGLAVKPFDLSLNFQNEIALQNVPEIETENHQIFGVNDILFHILSFIKKPKDMRTILLISKRFNDILLQQNAKSIFSNEALEKMIEDFKNFKITNSLTLKQSAKGYTYSSGIRIEPNAKNKNRVENPKLLSELIGEAIKNATVKKDHPKLTTLINNEALNLSRETITLLFKTGFKLKDEIQLDLVGELLKNPSIQTQWEGKKISILEDLRNTKKRKILESEIEIEKGIKSEIRNDLLKSICFTQHPSLFTKVKLLFNENEKIDLKEQHFFVGSYRINEIEVFKYLFDRIDDVNLLDTVFRNYLISNMYKEIEHGLQHPLLVPNKFIPLCSKSCDLTMLEILFNSPKVGKGPYEENLKEAFLLSCESGHINLVVLGFFIDNDKFDFSAYFKEGLTIAIGKSNTVVKLLTESLSKLQ